jgi:hypothetical protein
MEDNNGWQPAATAPKDGSWFMVVDKAGGMAWSPYELAAWQNSNWRESYFGGQDTSEKIEFDWWRPLPALPAL